MRLTKSLFLTPFAAILIACGGGGGDGTAPAPPTNTAPPPSTSAGDHASARRATIQAVGDATAAAVIPAAGTTTPLPVTSAGEIQIDGFAQYVTLFKTTDGRYYGLSDASGSYLVDPAIVTRVCFNSSQVGWNVTGFTSRSCAPLNADGYAELPMTCNKDIGTWNLDTSDGRKLWFDHTSERKFVRKGIVSTVQANGLVTYGSYQPATVAIRAGTAAGTVDVTYDWKNNCMGGFGKNGLLTDLNPNSADARIKFVWNSNKAGAGNTPGWGLLPIGDRAVSTKEAYAAFDTAAGSYSVTFTGLACNDRGNITVYKGTGPADNVTWDLATDGFGAGWGIIQNAADPFQFWSIPTSLPTGLSLSFDRTQFQLVWSRTGCNT
jgi:hypothetical protein